MTDGHAINGVNLVRLIAAAQVLRSDPGAGNVPLPPAAAAEWLDAVARAAGVAPWGADLPGLQLADQVARIVVGDAPAPDLPAGTRDKLLALLTSGPIGGTSGQRYVRADLIRAVIGEPDPGAPARPGDPEQPGQAALALAHAGNLHYRYCDQPDADDCDACTIARSSARATLRVLNRTGWQLIRLDSWADRCRAAARALRGPDVAERTLTEAYWHLIGDEAVGALGSALTAWMSRPTADTLTAALDRVAAVAAVLDHILDMVTGGTATLPEVMEAKFERDFAAGASPTPAAASSDPAAAPQLEEGPR